MRDEPFWLRKIVLDTQANYAEHRRIPVIDVFDSNPPVNNVRAAAVLQNFLAALR
ncbi:MAG: hypothetical protein ACJAYU_003789 [Bradymonadia bacterium]|jgi:hypothetical protein